MHSFKIVTCYQCKEIFEINCINEVNAAKKKKKKKKKKMALKISPSIPKNQYLPCISNFVLHTSINEATKKIFLSFHISYMHIITRRFNSADDFSDTRFILTFTFKSSLYLLSSSNFICKLLTLSLKDAEGPCLLPSSSSMPYCSNDRANCKHKITSATSTVTGNSYTG